MNVQADLPPLQCRDCFHKGAPYLSWQEFSNGTVHLRAECRECGRYIKYVPQDEIWLSGIAPWDGT